MANNCKQCFNTHYQPHCHPTTKSLWLCSSAYCGPPHPSRRIMVGDRSRQPKKKQLQGIHESLQFLCIHINFFQVCSCSVGIHCFWVQTTYIWEWTSPSKIQLSKACILKMRDAYFECLKKILTHWGRDKMAAICQTTFSNVFSWMKMYEFRLKFHWSLFLAFGLTISHHGFR